MNYVEIKINKSGELVCTYVNNDKKIIVEKKEIVKIISLLKRSNSIVEKIVVDGEETLRYYNVKQIIVNEIISNSISQTERKIQKNDKYFPVVTLTSAILTIVLMLNSCGKDNFKSNQETLKTINATTIERITKDKKPAWEMIFGKFGFEKSEKIEEENTVDRNFEFAYTDRSQIPDAIHVREKFYDTIEKYANMYGLPTNLMVALATEESRGRCDADSGVAFGLFQIKVRGGWNWVGKQLTAYNFEKGDYETVTVCLDKNGNLNPNMLVDPAYCSKIGCMIMANNLKRCNYDIICAIQAYNAGNKPLNLYKKYGEDWVYYREEHIPNWRYVEEVLSFVEPDNNIFTYTDIDSNVHTVSVTNVNQNAYKKTLTKS